MTYTPDTFADGISGGTPITAAKLNNIETELAAIDPLARGAGQLAGANNWTGSLNQFTASGNVVDLTGGLNANSAAGSYYRSSMGVSGSNGINDPARGDGLASNAANGSGASFFFGHYVNVGSFTGKGSFSGCAVFGTLGVNASYGELGGYQASLTCGRAGGLVEGYEASITDSSGQQGRVAGFTSVINEDNASITYWSRGFWATSAGTGPAGDAFFADGTAGWANYFVGTNAAGTIVTKINAAGTATFNNVLANAMYLPSDLTRMILWGTGSPNGVVTASPGSVYLNVSGGAAITLYVKESGTGNTGWVGK